MKNGKFLKYQFVIVTPILKLYLIPSSAVQGSKV